MSRESQAVNPDQMVFRSEHAAYRELAEDGGAVILNLETGSYHQLNPIGSLVWNLIGEGSTVAVIIQGVRAAVPDAPAGVQDDVIGFISTLADRDLARIGRPDDPQVG